MSLFYDQIFVALNCFAYLLSPIQISQMIDLVCIYNRLIWKITRENVKLISQFLIRTRINTIITSQNFL